jgi:hypothetical protein
MEGFATPSAEQKSYDDKKDDSSLDIAKSLDLVYFKLASLLFPNL